MTELKLSCGREVKIEAFHFQNPELFLHSMGVMIMYGSPERKRKHIVEKGPSRLNKIWAWGDLPAVFLDDPAPDDEEPLDGRKYPGYVAHVWLRSSGIAADADGSDLVVSFFPDRLDAPIQEMVQRGIRNLDWKSHAKDFRYEEIFPWFYGIEPEDQEPSDQAHAAGEGTTPIDL